MGTRGTPGPTRAGLLVLKMPALFVAMASTVEPNIRVWSSAMVVQREITVVENVRITTTNNNLERCELTN